MDDFNKGITNDLLNKETLGTTRDEFVSEDKQAISLGDIRNFRIEKTGLLTIPTAGTTASVEHDLGYIPAHLAYVSSTALPSGYNTIPYFVNDGVANPRVVANVTKNKLEFLKSFTTASVTIYYVIFREKAA